ncbi:hypothetical protein HID58_029622 [Brassica napus]|uniref:F-box associated beta-propeller type 3 domain-containing protein n=1 Tax=Brassica napus TaxID=3708 RepID=A0ABQ8CDL6_BRANA|nr:hypothetical protein HID58_029622 [Brassica napus]
MKAKSNQTGIYFGYDPVEKQFKVLCMYSSRVERPNTYQVLTLESGKRLWRTTERKFYFVEDHRMRGEICINGVLYFGAIF